MTHVNGKRVRDGFFQQNPESSDVWTSKYGTARKAGRGYANFISHVQGQHAQDLKNH